MKKAKGKNPKVAITTSDNRMGTAKKQTPVKVSKKKGPTRPPRQAATMPAPSSQVSAGFKEFHDPESDLHTLKRAEAVKSDKRRHAAAIAHGSREMSNLVRVVKGMKVSTRDV